MKCHILMLLPLIAIAACNTQTASLTEGPLTLSSSKPQTGEQVTLLFKADSSKLAGQTNPESVLYYAVKNNVYAVSLPLTDTANALHGTFTLPDSAQAFALKFSAGDSTDDNGGKGYIFPVYNKTGHPVPGSLAAASNFYFDYAGMIGATQNIDTVLQLMQKDFQAHPDIKKQWERDYLSSLLIAKKDSAYPEIQKQIGEILSKPGLKEKDYELALYYYGRIRMVAKSDSLTKIIKQEFPHGELVRNEKLMAISKLNDVDSLLKYYNEFKVKFPGKIDRARQIGNLLITPTESSVLYRIAEAYAARKQYDKYREYAMMGNDTMALQSKYNNMAWQLAQNGEDLAFADTLSKASLDLLQGQINNLNSKKPGYYTGDMWKKHLQNLYGQNADTYAMILAKQGNYKGAVFYQKKAVNDLDGKSSDVNERYAEYLIKDEDYATAQSEIEQFFTSGNNTSKMNDYLKTAYVKLKGSDKGFADYLSGLEAKADAKMKSDLAKSMIDKPAAAFDLPDLKGMDVALASLKGKVVVVDFWATWCGPCKASFPGMQKAVNQFKDNKNIVFLFVNTWENTTSSVRMKQVSDFIAQHKYTFHVLLDQHQRKDSTQYQVVSDYGVEGIPTKFIIDPNGKVRFKLVGFDGNTDKEAKKLAMMIDLVRG